MKQVHAAEENPNSCRVLHRTDAPTQSMLIYGFWVNCLAAAGLKA